MFLKSHYLLFCVFVLQSFCSSAAKKKYSPSYITPCSRSAPDFKECCIKRGNEALPTILKGDKKFGIPVFLPLKIPKVNIDAGNNLKLQMFDVTVFGLDTVRLKDMDMDFKNQRVKLEVTADRLELIGQYVVDGKIMVLPIQGKGPSNITVVGGIFRYYFPYKLDNRNGVDYAIVMEKNNKLDFNLQQAYFHLENLFNGDEKLGSSMNMFLNENWKEVFTEFGGAIQGTVGAIAGNIGRSVFGRIPFNELFLE